MCTVSDKLKLCTCDTQDYYQLQHYWTFHRFIAGKKNFIIGEALIAYLDRDLDQLNYETILRQLNEGNPFDVDLKPLRRDRLCLSFTSDNAGNRIYYGFRYNGRKWVKQGYDAHEWEWRHDEVQGGLVTNALTED
jgi:hypothetical protein